MSEPSEDFEVELRNPSRATLDDARGVGTIAADPMPGLTIDDAAPVAEGNDAVFTVTLHPQSSQVVTVEYTTEDGTADAGDDYTTIAETLTFSPGQTTKIHPGAGVGGLDAGVERDVHGGAEHSHGDDAGRLHRAGDDYGGSDAGSEHRGRGARGRGRRGGLHGDAGSGEQPRGDSDLLDGRRHRCRRRGLHPNLGDADLQSEPDDEDHPGPDPAGYRARAERDVHGGA